MTETELLPCPFCGGKFKMSQEPHDNGHVSGQFYIYHADGGGNCPIDIRRHFDSAEDAVAAWNTRPSTRASVSEAAVTDEMKTGWNSCRRQVYLLAEHEQDKGPYSADESEFARGYKYMAKSFARAFNAFEADDCDFLKEAALSAALASTAETPARRETWEEALECQPSTAENPNESAYQRGRFDGIMEYSRAIRARATEERDDG